MKKPYNSRARIVLDIAVQTLFYAILALAFWFLFNVRAREDVSGVVHRKESIHALVGYEVGIHVSLPEMHRSGGIDTSRQALSLPRTRGCSRVVPR